MRSSSCCFRAQCHHRDRVPLDWRESASLNASDRQLEVRTGLAARGRHRLHNSRCTCLIVCVVRVRSSVILLRFELLFVSACLCFVCLVVRRRSSIFCFFLAGSVTWTTIVTKALNGAAGGSFVWTVPFNAYVSDYTYLRVSFSADSTKFLAGDYFSVLPCKLRCFFCVACACTTCKLGCCLMMLLDTAPYSLCNLFCCLAVVVFVCLPLL